jgi:broad specificity polyphosphatase/5'/3'-nucleotidase SurE
MTFILTNDDGIDAPGIAALRQALNGHTTGWSPLTSTCRAVATR